MELLTVKTIKEVSLSGCKVKTFRSNHQILSISFASRM